MGVIRMARPVRREGSSNGQFRERIDVDVLSKVRGLTLTIPLADTHIQKRISQTAVEITLSLRTASKAEIEARHAQVKGYLEGVYAALRSDTPRTLSHKERVALAGEFYRSWANHTFSGRATVVDVSRDEQGNVITEVSTLDDLDDEGFDDPKFQETIYSSAEGNLDRHPDGPSGAVPSSAVRKFLLDRGINAAERSIELLRPEIQRAVREGLQRRQREASGDYSPDTNAQRFPALDVLQPTEAAKDPASTLSFDTLLATWKAHPEQKGIGQSTITTYFTAVRALKAFLKHDDATAVTRADVRRFSEHLATKVTTKTVNDNYLTGLKSVFSWAVRWDKHPGPNPAEGVRLKQRKQPTIRSERGFTDAEAVTILKHAWTYAPKSNRESPKMTAAKRWVPWLMAYSGVRVGEVAQLRKEDVIEHEGHHAIRISYDAGTTKTKATWVIPLHPHLIELGLLEFVKLAPDGHLFLTPRPDLYDAAAPESRTKDPRGILGPLQEVKNRLQEFARLVVKRKEASPNHGWRHPFKTVGREADIQQVVLDAFHDRAARSESDKYGQKFGAMVKALKKIPRYDIGLDAGSSTAE